MEILVIDADADAGAAGRADLEPDDLIPGVTAQLPRRSFGVAHIDDVVRLGDVGAPPLAAQAVVFGVSDDDEARLAKIEAAMRRAAAAEIPAIVVAGESVSPGAVHRLLSAGARGFVPWPFPDGALERALTAGSEAAQAPRPGARAPLRRGRVISVLHASGGVGASTLAVNLAWEMAVRQREARVALLDFDFQFGAAACALDLAERAEIDDLFGDPGAIEPDRYLALFTDYRGAMSVQTASPGIPPLDALSETRAASMIEAARAAFDVVIVDMPLTLARWAEAVLTRSDTLLPVARLGVREARNMSKLFETLLEARVDLAAVEPVLNFAPSSIAGFERSKARPFETSMGAPFRHWLPDGGRAVARAFDEGAPLAEAARRNPLRVAIARVAEDVCAAAPRAPAP